MERKIVYEMPLYPSARRGQRQDVDGWYVDGWYEENRKSMDIVVREITALPTLMHWRAEVIEEVYGEVPSKRLLVADRIYYRQHIADGSHIAVVAAVNDVDVGCGAICLTEELPTPDNPSGKCACLMNIYVRKEYRGKGAGHAIVRWLVDRATQLGCGKICLPKQLK